MLCFFFKHKTSYELRISDCGSDVCSSDLSPFGRDEGVLSHRVGDCIWICLGGEEKILPSAVVNEATNKKAAEVEAREGRKLGGRARQRLKDDVLQELLPRAFVTPVRANAYLDMEHGRSEERRVGQEWVRTCRSR